MDDTERERAGGARAPEEDDVAPARAPRVGPWRREVRAFVELLGLCGIAFVQPTLDLLSKNTGIFINRGTTGAQAILLTLAVVVLPPLGLWAGEVLVGLVLARARSVVHAAIAGVLVAVIAVESIKRATDLLGNALLGWGALLGALGGFLFWRFDALRQFTRYVAVAVPVFSLLFLFASPVTDIVFADDAEAMSAAGIESPQRLVMLVLDEFAMSSLLDGEGRVDAELYPNFARLAGDATFYRNYTTVAPYTGLAVPTIVTGQADRARERF